MILFFFLMFFWVYQLVIWISSLFYDKEETKLEKKISSKELYLPNEKLERKMYWNAKKILEENLKSKVI